MTVVTRFAPSPQAFSTWEACARPFSVGSMRGAMGASSFSIGMAMLPMLAVWWRKQFDGPNTPPS